ncbi:uncharacterized protein LOC120339750 isoform X1 [Styela clava]
MAMFTQVLVICLASLLHNAFANVCPSIIGEKDKFYEAEQTLMFRCDKKPNMKYTAVCKNSGLWDHSRSDNECQGIPASPDSPKFVPPAQTPNEPVPPILEPAAPAPAAPQTVISLPQTVVSAPQPAAPAPPAVESPTPAVAAVPAVKPEGCSYLPGYMRVGDAEIIWADSRQYRMRCDDNTRLFVATCRIKAWVFEENSCKGPLPPNGFLSNLFGPIDQVGPLRPGIGRPPSVVQPNVNPPTSVGGPPQNTFSSFFDNIADGLNNLLKPLTSPRQTGEQTQGGGGLFGSLDRAFNNLFQPITNQNVNPITNIEPLDFQADLKPCAYDPQHIQQGDEKIHFHHGYRYKKALCNQGTNRVYEVFCRDGGWIFDEEACVRPPNNGNIFNTNLPGGIPLWLLALGG